MVIATPTNFKSDAEKTRWIIAHADHFTTFVYLARIRHSDRYNTLAQAEKAAHSAAGVLCKPIMIYAVAPDGRDTYVKTIKPEVSHGPQEGAKGAAEG